MGFLVQSPKFAPQNRTTSGHLRPGACPNVARCLSLGLRLAACQKDQAYVPIHLATW